jgi:hypothetical protein
MAQYGGLKHDPLPEYEKRPFTHVMDHDVTATSGISKLSEIFLRDRDRRFAEGNDKVWGKGNWIRCHSCLDGMGYPSYHHKDSHEG